MPTNDLRKLRSVDWALNKYSDQRYRFKIDMSH